MKNSQNIPEEALFLFILLVGMVGCYLGDRHSLSRTVSLNLQESQRTKGVDLSLTNAEVQEAIKVIDAVLSTNGFVREARPDMASVPGFVAGYVQYDSSGLRLATLPDVYMHSNRLDVEIVELGNRTTHPTALMAKICASLRTELGSRYGGENVKIRD